MTSVLNTSQALCFIKLQMGICVRKQKADYILVFIKGDESTFDDFTSRSRSRVFVCTLYNTETIFLYNTRLLMNIAHVHN